MAQTPDDMRKTAVAMAYRAEDGAPRIVAKGRGVSAEAIISLARENGVYVHPSPELVNLLMQIDRPLFDRVKRLDRSAVKFVP